MRVGQSEWKEKKTREKKVKGEIVPLFLPPIDRLCDNRLSALWISLAQPLSLSLSFNHLQVPLPTVHSNCYSFKKGEKERKREGGRGRKWDLMEENVCERQEKREKESLQVKQCVQCVQCIFSFPSSISFTLCISSFCIHVVIFHFSCQESSLWIYPLKVETAVLWNCVSASACKCVCSCEFTGSED